MSVSPDRLRPPLPHARDVSFTVATLPVAQPRARSSFHGGRPYVPSGHPIHVFKAVVQLAAHQAFQGPPHDGPVILALQFLMPRPKSHGKRRRQGREPHTGKPDCDNLAKAVMDSLNEILWVDDSQIFCVSVTKLYAEDARGPGVDVEVEMYLDQQPGARPGTN